MGGIFLLLFFLFLIKKSPQDRRNSDLGRSLIIGFAMLCVAIPILMDLLPFLGGIALVGGFGALIFYLVKMIQEQNASDKRAQQYGWDPEKWNRNDQENRNYRGNSTSRRTGTTYYQNSTSSRQTGANYNQTGTSNSQSSYSGRSTGTYSGTETGRSAGAYSSTGTYSGTGTYSSTETGRSAGTYSTTGHAASYTQQTSAPTTLPRTVKKRRKIVESFNEKYDLDLTDEQMNSIVNSSYMSEIWRRELEAMDRKYETVYEWFQGSMGWLRAYMYVFHIQEITSDIRQQEEICMYTFETVFQYVDTLDGISQSKKIDMVNNKYFTSFDDVSFMIAYRFLEEKGLNHDLKGPELAKNADTADDLVNKYAPREEEKLGL